MIDVIALGVTGLVVLAVFLRKTSAGVAVLALLAGVMLDQMLANWVIEQLPEQTTALKDHLPVIVHLLITFAPVVTSLVAVKVHKHNAVLSLLTSLVLGFLVMFFGVKIVTPIPAAKEFVEQGGLLYFLQPYQNGILTASAFLAVTEMVMSHRSGTHDKKKKK
jgi:ABC-type glucose/galactose transport system permease subunit